MKTSAQLRRGEYKGIEESFGSGSDERAIPGCGAVGEDLAISRLFLQVGNEFNPQWAAEMLVASMIGGRGPMLGYAIFFVMQQTLENYGACCLIIFGTLAVGVAI